MFFLFGWGNRHTKDFGNTLLQECSVCSKSNYFNLIRVRDWFDIFFIPIIPYNTEYHLICSNCENGFETEDDDIEILKEMAELIEKFENGEITKKETEKEHRKLLKEYLNN